MIFFFFNIVAVFLMGNFELTPTPFKIKPKKFTLQLYFATVYRFVLTHKFQGYFLAHPNVHIHVHLYYIFANASELET